MAYRNGLIVCMAAALATTACSTKPRTFSASVRPSATVAATQDESLTFSTCDKLVRKGHKGNFTSVAASGAAGAVAGTAGGMGIAMSSLGGSSLTAGVEAASVAMPVIGLAAAFGVNRAIRAGRERKYKRAMGACMEEFGYSVIDWRRMRKKQPGSAVLIPQDAAGPSQASDPKIASMTR